MALQVHASCFYQGSQGLFDLRSLYDMKKLYLVFLLCVYAYVVVAQVVPRRNLGQRNLGALQQYIEISNARYDAAIAYKSGIEKYYVN